MNSSIDLLVATVLLLFLVSPLQSDPQRTWTNQEAYYPAYQSGNPVVFPDEYSASSIQKPPSYSSTNEGNIYEANYFPHRSTDGRYEPKYFRKAGYYDYSDYPTSSEVKESKNVQKDNEWLENAESDTIEEDIREKMEILDKLLSDEIEEKDIDTNIIEGRLMPEETKRIARQIRKQRPNKFWTLARVTFETFNDTKSAIKQISEIINNNILPDSATQRSVTSGSLTASSAMAGNASSVNTTQTPMTTTTQQVLTRSVLQSLIRRNVLGLVRLFNIEWNDALNQSKVNVQEFRRELGKEVGRNLRDNPNAY